MSGWMSTSIWIEHDSGVEALQFMEDLTDVISQMVFEFCEDSPFVPDIYGYLDGDGPDGDGG